mgnify:CR=1 FL=1
MLQQQFYYRSQKYLFLTRCENRISRLFQLSRFLQTTVSHGAGLDVPNQSDAPDSATATTLVRSGNMLPGALAEDRRSSIAVKNADRGRWALTIRAMFQAPSRTDVGTELLYIFCHVHLL